MNFKLSLIILTISILSFSCKNNKKTDQVAKNTSNLSLFTTECFMERFNGFEQKYPKKKGLLQGYYATSEHSLTEFMKRFNEFEQKYPKKKGLLQGYYATSEHSLTEFMKRFNEFEQKYPKKKGLLQGYYATSEHNLCD